MEKLMKPTEYAEELGISRQAVYAKIKKGILPSKHVDGKLYIVVDGTTVEKGLHQKEKITKHKKENIQDYKALLEAKDETISVLKETVVDLKESNKQISTTLKSEIDLLKEAFYEMRTLYVHQLEHKQTQETIAVEADEESTQWIGLKKWYKQQYIIKEKQQKKLLKQLKKMYKQGDTRMTKIEGKLKLDADKSYEDVFTSCKF